MELEEAATVSGTVLTKGGFSTLLSYRRVLHIQLLSSDLHLRLFCAYCSTWHYLHLLQAETRALLPQLLIYQGISYTMPL